MKKISIVLFISILCVSAFAQMEIPRPSPNAEVKQTVGITNIAISYSSPGVKGRKGAIWGDLIAYDKVWRMGANSSTEITFSKEVKVEGNVLKAGTYSLGAFPGREEWTLVFSNQLNLGGWGEYDSTKDALRIQVKPKSSDFNERLQFTITDFDNDKGTVNMDWENLQVSFTVAVNTNEDAWSSIQGTLDNSWRNYTNAARYALQERKDYATAMQWIEQSIDLKETWFNTWVKADIYKQSGDEKNALKTAKKAMELGIEAEKKGENFFFKDMVKKAVDTWGKK